MKGPDGEDGGLEGPHEEHSDTGHKDERGEDLVPTRIRDRWGNGMMYTRGEDAWQAARQDLKGTEAEDEAYASGRDTANGQIAGAPPEEAGTGVKRKPMARVKTSTDPPTNPNSPCKRNKPNGPPPRTKPEETDTHPDPGPDSDTEPAPDSDPNPDPGPSDHTQTKRGATHQHGTEGARPNGLGQTQVPGQKRRHMPKGGLQGQHQPAGTGEGQWATDRWQCVVCRFEHVPESEAASMVGQGERYDG